MTGRHRNCPKCGSPLDHVGHGKGTDGYICHECKKGFVYEEDQDWPHEECDLVHPPTDPSWDP